MCLSPLSVVNVLCHVCVGCSYISNTQQSRAQTRWGRRGRRSHRMRSHWRNLARTQCQLAVAYAPSECRPSAADAPAYSFLLPTGAPCRKKTL